MVVNLEQIQMGITRYVENEIAPKAVGFKKFGVFFLLPTLQKTATNYVLKIKEFMPELFDENNNIKLDEFYAQAKNAIQKSGQFELMGIIFNETDVDKLYSHIRNTVIGG